MEYSYKFRLYPNQEQEILIQKTFGCCRFLYNYFLAERKDAYEKTGKSPSWTQQSAEIPGLKKEYPWLKEPDAHALIYAVKDLNAAYQNFFRRVKAGQTPGYPRFKSKGDNHRSYRTSSPQIQVSGNHIVLPKLGPVKCSVHRDVQGRILSACVSQDPSGKYYIALCCTDVRIDPLPAAGSEIGVQAGLIDIATTSDGVRYPNPKRMKQNRKKLARLQRQLSRKQKGSRNREKARIRLAKAHEKIANQRKDALHKMTTDLIRGNDLIAVRGPESAALADTSGRRPYDGPKGRNMNRTLYDAAWGEAKRQLEYKAGWYGRELAVADELSPTSQTCSCCGTQHPFVKDLSVREWTCPACGAEHVREVNAAKNILAEGRRVLSSPAA